MKRYIRKQRCETVKNVVEVINRFWSNITPKYCGNYINHLRKVIYLIILSNMY
jgi:hypothetical protein